MEIISLEMKVDGETNQRGAAVRHNDMGVISRAIDLLASIHGIRQETWFERVLGAFWGFHSWVALWLVQFEFDAQPTASLESVLQLQRLHWCGHFYLLCMSKSHKTTAFNNKKQTNGANGGNIRLFCYRLRLQEPQLHVAQDRMPGSPCAPTIHSLCFFPLDWV
jgi:hypothetical protein